MVHSFKKAGYAFALDAGSGAVHMLDDIAYDLVQELTEDEIRSGQFPQRMFSNLKQHETEDMEQSYGELYELLQNGALYSDDSYAEFANELGEAPVKAMCLHVAHDCNLRCRYCFASTGNFGGQRQLMGFETAKKSIDMLISLSGQRRNLEVDFFGGEPLMNFDVVKQTVAYARSLEEQFHKNFRFTITTNGLALTDDKIDYINREMSNVVLSLDGRRSINDDMRPLISGEGSYEVIVPKFQQLVNERGDKEYYVRGTYTRNNLDFDQDVLHLSDLGFYHISVEPVVGPEEDTYSIRSCDMEQIAFSYNKLLERMIHNVKTKNPDDFNFFHFMLDLDNGPCAIKRLKGCGSGNEYVAITPDGEIYPCHQFVDNKDYLMGTVDTGIVRADIRARFAQANLLSKKECQNCWAKFYCSGGCNANNNNFSQDILKPHQISCQLEKQRLECAIALQSIKKII